jgi:Protein of unknown function (DUF3237)
MSPATETPATETSAAILEGNGRTTPLLERPSLSQLPVEHLCDLRVDLEPAQLIGTPVGARMVFIAKGGRVEGPRFQGELLPGGGDWLLVGEDRIGRVDVRATVRTDDGALIHYTAGGIIEIPDDGLERLAAGERLPFEETYVRTTPKFETADERYSWLNRLVVVGHNELSKDHIDYRMYRVL